MAGFSAYIGTIAVLLSITGHLWEPFFARLGFLFGVIAFVVGAIALITNRGAVLAAVGMFLGGACVIASVLAITYIFAMGLGHRG